MENVPVQPKTTKPICLETGGGIKPAIKNKKEEWKVKQVKQQAHVFSGQYCSLLFYAGVRLYGYAWKQAEASLLLKVSH